MQRYGDDAATATMASGQSQKRNRLFNGGKCNVGKRIRLDPPEEGMAAGENSVSERRCRAGRRARRTTPSQGDLAPNDGE